MFCKDCFNGWHCMLPNGPAIGPSV